MIAAMHDAKYVEKYEEYLKTPVLILVPESQGLAG
jgi:hypothetical protein